MNKLQPFKKFLILCLSLFFANLYSAAALAGATTVEFFSSNNREQINLETAYKRLQGKPQLDLQATVAHIIRINRIKAVKQQDILGLYLSSNHQITADNASVVITSFDNIPFTAKIPPNPPFSKGGNNIVPPFEKWGNNTVPPFEKWRNNTVPPFEKGGLGGILQLNELVFKLAKKLAETLKQESVAVFISGPNTVSDIKVNFVGRKPTIQKVLIDLHKKLPPSYGEALSLYLDHKSTKFNNVKVVAIEWLGSKNLKAIRKAFPHEKISYSYGNAFLVYRDGSVVKL